MIVDDVIVEKIEKEIHETTQKLWKEMSDEMSLHKLTPSLFISKIRDYNVEWNKIAESNPFMKLDGFKILAKKLFSNGGPLPTELIDALKYL